MVIKMKRFVRLILILMIIMLLSACGTAMNSADSIRTVNIDGVEKQVIKLAAINKRSEWLTQVIKGFNESSASYHVEVNYYMDSYLSPFSVVEITSPQRTKKFAETVAEAGLLFNIDLAAGNIPDIVLVPAQMQTNSYITMGLFADLNAFIDNDPDFDRADYLPSLFEIFDRNGRMYEIPPMFLMYGLYVKTADIGTDIGWTLDEFATYIESKPDAEYIIASITKNDFIIKMVQYLFVNPVTGEVRFDRDEFEKILAVAERFPTELYDYVDDIGGWEKYFWMNARNGDPIMLPLDIPNFHMPLYWGNLFFGEEVTIKGWPSSSDSGPLLSAENYFSIMKEAENPDGAWAFLKYTLNHVAVDKRLQWLLPVNMSLLEEIKEDMDALGITDQENDHLRRRSEYDRLMTLFKSAKRLKREDATISKIIDEEIGGYLGGQRSVDEIIAIIENRIWIYLAEQK